MEKTKTPEQNNKISLIGGVFFLIIGYLLLRFDSNTLVLKTAASILFAFGVSLLTYFFIGKTQIAFSLNGVKAQGFLALLFGLLTLVFLPILKIKENKSIMVKFKNKEGVSILKNEKQIIKVSYSTDTKTYNINNDGEFPLIDIPTDIDSLQFEILHLDWQFLNTHKKSAKFPTHSDNFEVILESVNERCCIYGKVYITEKKIVKKGIKVTLQHRYTITDERGNYKFELTESEKLLDYLPIEAEFQNYSGKSDCTTFNQCDIIIR